MNLTCVNCHETKSFSPAFAVREMIKDHFVCAVCLFPSPMPDEPIATYASMPKNAPAVILTPTKPITRNVDHRICDKPRLADLFKRGIIAYGDKLMIVGHAESDAQVIDSKTIRLGSSLIMTWNEYGQKFTGHKTVNIYKHVVINGRLLESLR